uniref:Uncharacterized protein n=1 Tax=Siphoviridae sp. ct4sp3 TaxID=2825332 RepID=A0A8S5PU84_9CAUD|nr:MAG TPA: hypothetical protein [Siphoviridae sp. ct4sp3]
MNISPIKCSALERCIRKLYQSLIRNVLPSLIF